MPLSQAATSSRPSSPHSLVFVHSAASPSLGTSGSSRGSRGSFGSGSGRRSATTTPLRTAEQAELDDWLLRYSRGEFPGDTVPKPPPAIETILEEAACGKRPASPSSMFIVSGDGPEHPLDQFRRLGHLQAPKAPWEDDRLRLARKFGLEEPRRRAALDSICRLVQSFFGMTTVVISLTFEDHQVLAGEVGWGGEDPVEGTPPRPLDLSPAFCTHALISAPQPDQTFVTGNADEDWRFAGSPYVTRNGGGLAFYAAANVLLEVDEADQKANDLPESLPVGALCLISDKPRDSSTFTTQDRAQLRLFADMIARELDLAAEQRRRENEVQKADVIGEFLNSALILPEKASSPSPPLDPGLKAFPAAKPLPTPASVYATAVGHLSNLTAATSAAILDLRSFRAPIPGRSPMQERPHARRDTLSGGEVTIREKLYLLGSTGDVPWEEIMRKDELLSAVGDTILEYFMSSTIIYDNTSRIQPMAPALPSDITSTICLPLLDAGTGFPSLMIVLTSNVPHFTFLESDVRFSKNIGAVTMSFLLKERAEAADKAKRDFLGAVSHKIRTPLHGITSQIELIREFSTPSQLKRLAPLLDTADLCLESLSDVLEDTLDLSKFANTIRTSADVLEEHKRSLVPRDLEQVLEDCAKATWVRKKRTDLVAAGGDAPSTPGGPAVDLILVVHDRPGGWDSAMIDVGGLKRVILNILGNSLKFTSEGHIKISLREIARDPARAPSTTNKATVRFEVEDTGIGMSDDFLRNKLFTPFIQQNSFANGAGLGMSLCETIVKRMQGEISVASTLGKGTTIAVTLPIEFASAALDDTVASSTPRTRIISKELADLFNPGPAHLVLSSSPQSEIRPSFDFQQAVDAAQHSPSLVRMPSDRRRGSKGSLLGQRGEQGDLVHEAAKLAIATVGSDEEHASSMTVQAPSPTTRRKVRVLVADDNSIARNIFIKLFTGKSIDFAAAEDGQELFDLYKNAGDSPFHLICTDVQMPNVDGIEASKMVREWEQAQGLPRCRIIALTGLSADETMMESDSIDSWIVKGGKSMRLILDEVAAVQEELDQRV